MRGPLIRKRSSPLTPLARNLRLNSTDAERWLWSRLRAHQLEGFKFRRQVPVGPYIADFLCAEPALIVELDGGQHAEAVAKDQGRTLYLEAQGYRVLRFWNNEGLQEGEEVLEEILRALRS